MGGERPPEQVLPSTSGGRTLCLATHLGPLMPAGHCQPLWLHLAPVGGIFHSVTQQGQVLGLWALDRLRVSVWAKLPALPVLTSHT